MNRVYLSIGFAGSANLASHGKEPSSQRVSGIVCSSAYWHVWNSIADLLWQITKARFYWPVACCVLNEQVQWPIEVAPELSNYAVLRHPLFLTICWSVINQPISLVVCLSHLLNSTSEHWINLQIRVGVCLDCLVVRLPSTFCVAHIGFSKRRSVVHLLDAWGEWFIRCLTSLKKEDNHIVWSKLTLTVWPTSMTSPGLPSYWRHHNAPIERKG